MVVLNIFIFTPTWGNDPIWLIFLRWVETTNQIMLWQHFVSSLRMRLFPERIRWKAPIAAWSEDGNHWNSWQGEKLLGIGLMSCNPTSLDRKSPFSIGQYITNTCTNFGFVYQAMCFLTFYNNNSPFGMYFMFSTHLSGRYVGDYTSLVGNLTIYYNPWDGDSFNPENLCHPGFSRSQRYKIPESAICDFPMIFEKGLATSPNNLIMAFSFTLPKTNSSPQKISLPKRKGSSSNHPCSGAFAVSFREGDILFLEGESLTLPAGNWMYNVSPSVGRNLQFCQSVCVHAGNMYTVIYIFTFAHTVRV